MPIPPAPAPLAPARRRFASTYQAIRQRICLLDYAPGERLSEMALALEFGTSRTPIRRVLARLEDEGLVRSVQSVGTIVTDVNVEQLSQIYALRMELAKLIGHLDPIATPVPDGLIARIRAQITAIENLFERTDMRAFAQTYIAAFHAVMALTRNEPLREMSERLDYRTVRIWCRSIEAGCFREEAEFFHRELTDILSAVSLGDLVAVGHIRCSHISMSCQRLRRKFIPKG